MSRIRYVVVHRADENNVGDLASNPLQYFLQRDEYQVVDISNVNASNYPGNVPIIVGGGGLIANEFFGDIIRDFIPAADKNQLLKMWDQRWHLSDPANQEAYNNFLNEYQALVKSYINKLSTNLPPRYVWGAGHNAAVTKKNKLSFDYPNWLAEFTKVGVRDWKQGHKWVPCASCMHPALRKTYPIKNDVIWFEHKKQLIKSFGSDSIPRFINSGSNIEQTIELLGGANTIITNSYHGAYWGTLLKKRVVVVDPWSTKFYGLKHKPAIVEKADEWRDGLSTAVVYPNAIDECINETQMFWDSIK